MMKPDKYTSGVRTLSIQILLTLSIGKTKRTKMKTIKIIWLFIIISQSIQAQIKPCPATGDNKAVKFQQLDSLKNRHANGGSFIFVIDINRFLALPQADSTSDLNRFSNKMFARIDGYIVKVKWGGAETCECHSKDSSQLDIHIMVAKDKDHIRPEDCMVWEINRFNRADNPLLSYAYVQSLTGQEVTGVGWLFADIEHKQNAENSNPFNPRCERATVWELHSMSSIKKKDGK